MGESCAYEVRRVVGEGCAGPLLCADIPLPNPANAILEIRKTVLIDGAHVTLGNVILQGRLRTEFIYTPAAGGQLLTLDTDTAFTLAVPVAAAGPLMTATVFDAFVADAVIEPRINRNGAIIGIVDKSILYLAVRVTAAVEVVAPCPGTMPVPAPLAKCERPSATICYFTQSTSCGGSPPGSKKPGAAPAPGKKSVFKN